MSTRARGMDHAHYPYSPANTRPRLQWPGDRRIAVNVVLYFEYLELEPPAGSVRDPRFHWRPDPDIRQHSWHEYGARVGIFRVLDALSRHDFNVTVAANAMACERYGYLVDAFKQRGYEFAAHGISASRMITSKMTEAEERETIRETLKRITAAVGTCPKGWICQDYGESFRTPSLMAEVGMDYIVNWPNDDQPYRMTAGELVSIPNQAAWDDVQFLWDRHMPLRRYPQIIGDVVEAFDREGHETGKYLGLGLHPWLIGAPHRIRYLEEALAKVAACQSIWRCTAGQVASHFRSTTPHK
jgi:allantoinase